MPDFFQIGVKSDQCLKEEETICKILGGFAIGMDLGILIKTNQQTLFNPKMR